MTDGSVVDDETRRQDRTGRQTRVEARSSQCSTLARHVKPKPPSHRCKRARAENGPPGDRGRRASSPSFSSGWLASRQIRGVGGGGDGSGAAGAGAGAGAPRMNPCTGPLIRRSAIQSVGPETAVVELPVCGQAMDRAAGEGARQAGRQRGHGAGWPGRGRVAAASGAPWQQSASIRRAGQSTSSRAVHVTT